jgi:MFS family permease
MLLAIVLGWFFSFGIRLIYPALVEYVRADFGISNSIVGLLFTIIMVAYGLMQFPSGILSDSVGERRVLIASLSITTIGCALLALSPTFHVFALGCIVFGLGTGMYSTPQFSILAKLFPGRTATVHGIAYGAGGVGTALPVLAGVLAATLTWRLGFGILLPGLAIALAGLWWFVPVSENRDPVTRQSIIAQVRPVVSVATSSDLVVPFIAAATVAFVYQVITAFLPAYLIDIKGIASLQATVLYGLFFVLGIGSQIYGGVLGDRYKLEPLLFAMALLGGGGLVVIALTDAIALIALMIVPLSFVSGFISMANTYIIGQLPDQTQGGGLGLLRMGILLTGSISPTIVGYISDLGYFTEAMLGVAGLLFVVAGLTLYMYVQL